MTERYGRWGHLEVMSAWEIGTLGGDEWFRCRKRFAVVVLQHPEYGWWTVRVLNPNGKEIERFALDTERGAKSAATRALRRHAP